MEPRVFICENFQSQNKVAISSWCSGILTLMRKCNLLRKFQQTLYAQPIRVLCVSKLEDLFYFFISVGRSDELGSVSMIANINLRQSWYSQPIQNHFKMFFLFPRKPRFVCQCPSFSHLKHSLGDFSARCECPLG